MAGQDALLKDNASLAQEKIQLWETMQGLSEYAVFAKALDTATASRIDEMKMQGQIEEARQARLRRAVSRSASATRTS